MIRKRSTLCILIVFVYSFLSREMNGCHAQGKPSISDTLNKRNSAGHKQGWWIQYRDSKLNTTKKPEKAAYYEYIYFDDGNDGNNLSLGLYPLLLSRQRLVKVESQNPSDSSIAQMNGTYSIYQKSTMKLLSQYTYSNGIFVRYYEFASKESNAYSWEVNWSCTNYLQEALFTEYTTEGKPFSFTYIVCDRSMKEGREVRRVKSRDPISLPRCSFPGQ